ncbi:MAG: PGF-pre-PGF domain-containing protein [Candidatus Methanoperedens sp.]|nr:PGF-pre-PGF domain-containing protein [Candidatus Methanoperedens sp.]MCZ7403441.1 PGF-pre-PGF domain-containing protein [Candidatus Methanoperedens sp.]
MFISIPDDLIFSFGEMQKELAVTVRNNGTAGGLANVNMTMPGIGTQTNSTWLLPGEETSISFNAMIPDDLEEKNYKMFYEMNGIRKDTSYFVNGANISVNAYIDKVFYNDGENATLTMEVTNEGNNDLSLQARVQFNGFEKITDFNLSGNGLYTLTLEVPVNFTGDSKMLYSVYTATGRSLYINSMFVNKMPPLENGILVYMDKQVYNVGDTATITIDATKAGHLNLTATKHFNYSGDINPGITTLNLPILQLLTGTYYIIYTFDNISASYPFDVSGYSAKIIESTLDRKNYSSGETIRMNFTIEASRSFNGTLSISIQDPAGTQLDKFDINMSFIEGENKLEVNRTLNADISGLYVIVPTIYTDLSGHSRVIIVSGSEYFDVETYTPSPSPTPTPSQTLTLSPGVISSSGGTGSNGVTTSEPASNIIMSETQERDITGDQLETYTFSALEHGIYEIIVMSHESQNNFAIRIEALKGRPKVATVSGPGIIYKYINIWAGTNNIKEVPIKFRVENSWLQANGIAESDISMIIWDGGKWMQLETIEISKDAIHTYYEAKSPHLSSFAITGLKYAAIPEATSKVTGRETTTTMSPLKSPVTLNWIIYMVIALGIIAPVYNFVIKKKKL